MRDSPSRHHRCPLRSSRPPGCWCGCLHLQGEELHKEGHEEGHEPALRCRERRRGKGKEFSVRFSGRKLRLYGTILAPMIFEADVLICLSVDVRPLMSYPFFGFTILSN